MARKTPLRKPNHGEGIISIKPRPKSVHDFLGLLYRFIVLLCICVVSCPYMIYYPTVMARYSLFVLKVPLNPKQTNKLGWRTFPILCQTASWMGDHFLVKHPLSVSQRGQLSLPSLRGQLMSSNPCYNGLQKQTAEGVVRSVTYRPRQRVLLTARLECRLAAGSRPRNGDEHRSLAL